MSLSKKIASKVKWLSLLVEEAFLNNQIANPSWDTSDFKTSEKEYDKLTQKIKDVTDKLKEIENKFD